MYAEIPRARDVGAVREDCEECQMYVRSQIVRQFVRRGAIMQLSMGGVNGGKHKAQWCKCKGRGEKT